MTRITVAAVSLSTVLSIMLGAGPDTEDAHDEQTEDNRNSQSVVTLPNGGPVTVF